MVSTPVETVNMYKAVDSEDTVVLGGSFTTFIQEGEIIVPYRSYVLELEDPISKDDYTELSISYGLSTPDIAYDSRYDQKMFSRYYTNGNLNYTIDASGIRTDYYYSDTYNNTLLTSKKVNDLTTSYTYIPLVGVESITDPNGRTISYEYDHLNRLHLNRDHRGNIVKRYRYYHKNEGNDISAGITVTGKNKTGVQLKFESTNAASFYGATRHVWEFGDGTVEETNGPSITHSYTTSGLKSVKLTLINPDYEPVQKFSSVNVKSADMTVSVCSSTTSYDICDGPAGDGDGCAPLGPSGVSFMADTDNGAHCLGGLSYQWFYKMNGSATWQELGNDPQISAPEVMLLVAGTYNIKCEVRDVCGTVYTGTQNVVVTKGSGCNGGFE